MSHRRFESRTRAWDSQGRPLMLLLEGYALVAAGD